MWKVVIIIAIALAALGLFSWIVSYFKCFQPKQVADASVADAGQAEGEESEETEECCGQHEVCEKDMKTMATKDIVYYDDEELDAYRQLSPEQYDEAALEAFSEVFYTLREDDVLGWLNSLRMREIEAPQFIREEALLIISEKRYQSAPTDTINNADLR